MSSRQFVVVVMLVATALNGGALKRLNSLVQQLALLALVFDSIAME
jgi:hypothetical protein